MSGLGDYQLNRSPRSYSGRWPGWLRLRRVATARRQLPAMLRLRPYVQSVICPQWRVQFNCVDDLPMDRGARPCPECGRVLCVGGVDCGDYTLSSYAYTVDGRCPPEHSGGPSRVEVWASGGVLLVAAVLSALALLVAVGAYP